MTRPRRFPVWRAVVFLKGGNWFEFRAEDIMIDRRGDSITNLRWERIVGRYRPLSADPREIQAVCIQPLGHHWRKP